MNKYSNITQAGNVLNQPQDNKMGHNLYLFVPLQLPEIIATECCLTKTINIFAEFLFQQEQSVRESPQASFFLMPEMGS